MANKDIIPITKLKNEASELVRQVVAERRTLTVTQNGEAKVVVVGIDAWHEQQETLAMLQLLALSERAIDEGRTATTDEAFGRARQHIEAMRRRD